METTQWCKRLNLYFLLCNKEGKAILPIERQNQIRRLIQTEKVLRISELSKQLGVSEMTIHRDIKPLADQGLITKTPGGITLTENNHQTLSSQKTCIYCHQPNHPKMIYRLILSDDTIETACCAHCGLLRHRQRRDDVSYAICHDFFMNTTISATLTWFVMDTTLNVACCQPQVLTFENKEHAEKFIVGFGGKIYKFQEAMDVICRKMEGYSGCCNHE